jgi:hypothetical protein
MIWAFVAFALMAGVLLWEEHRAHLLGILPYLFLLACPLVHMLMHGRKHTSRNEEHHHA